MSTWARRPPKETPDDDDDVAEVAAFGVPHPALDEELAVIVCLTEAGTASADDLRAFAAALLAAFKVPAHVHLSRRPLPRTATGKVTKQGLAEFAA